MHGFIANALTEALEDYGVENQDRIVDGQPQMSKKVVWRSADGTLTQGVWEMTEGAIEGFDNNETFVVVEGRATVEFTNRGEKFDLAAGHGLRDAEGRSHTDHRARKAA
jgi:uncharacterized cupin superfamily protein